VFERAPGGNAGLRAFWRFCKQIRASRYDIVADFHGILKTGIVAGLSRAPKRYGFTRPRGQELSPLFANHRVKLPSHNLNRVEENLLLCDALCPRGESFDSTIFVPHDIQDEVDAFYEETFAGGKLVVAMHPPVDRPEKQWPLEHFAQLADMLLADGRFEVLLTWGPGQFDIVNKVLAAARRNPVVAPETPNLKHYAWLVHRADLYFGGDSGPMHIAAAMGTPVVAVFGGTDPAKHAPYQRPCEILYHPGTTERLPAGERLRRISPDMAFDACVRLVTR
jgi:ADP-heptose:LPS heptosyltransferase